MPGAPGHARCQGLAQQQRQGGQARRGNRDDLKLALGDLPDDPHTREGAQEDGRNEECNQGQVRGGVEPEAHGERCLGEVDEKEEPSVGTDEAGFVGSSQK